MGYPQHAGQYLALLYCWMDWKCEHGLLGRVDGVAAWLSYRIAFFLLVLSDLELSTDVSIRRERGL